VTRDELESLWAALQPPGTHDAISGRRAAGLPADRPVYLAVDSRHRRHLLVQLPDGTEPVSQRETLSLEVTTARFTVGSNPDSLYIDLLCTDSSQYTTFSAVAQDLIHSFRQSQSPVRELVINTLARWRAFWAVKIAGMNREEALGLFGELWFLRRWLGAVNAGTVRRWQATESARHDFQWALASVEVKTASTQSAAPPVHRITSLEQLADPEQGALFLFSLQVYNDALAANTLQNLVNALTADLHDDFAALEEFNEKVAARGYTPDCQFATMPLRILGERLYRVDATFPRIIRQSFGTSGAPHGVVSVSYELDLSACDNWLLAKRPQDVGALLA
jgi:hypothetical protein